MSDRPAVTINGSNDLNAWWSPGLEAVVMVLPTNAARALRSALHDHIRRRGWLTGRVLTANTDDILAVLDRALQEIP